MQNNCGQLTFINLWIFILFVMYYYNITYDKITIYEIQDSEIQDSEIQDSDKLWHIFVEYEYTYGKINLT